MNECTCKGYDPVDPCGHADTSEGCPTHDPTAGVVDHLGAVLETVTDRSNARYAARAELVAAIGTARADGATWQQIAIAMGYADRRAAFSWYLRAINADIESDGETLTKAGRARRRRVLTDSFLREIAEQVSAGMSPRQIGERHGVSRPQGYRYVQKARAAGFLDDGGGES